MSNFLTLRVVNSPYIDFTKDSVLSFAEMDDNFIFLKGNLIYTAETIGNTVTLKKYNGDDLSFIAGETFTGGTISGTTNFTGGLTADTISATTYYNLPIDIYVTGFTYDNSNNFTIKQNGYADLTTTINTMTGLTMNGNINMSNNAIYTNSAEDTAIYFGNEIVLTQAVDTPTGWYSSLTVEPGSIASQSVYQNQTSQMRSLGTNNFLQVASGTSLSTLYQSYDKFLITTLSHKGIEYNGDYSASFTDNTLITKLYVDSVVSAKTDVSITGGTYTSGTTTFTNNTGGTFSVSGFFKPSDDIYTTGVTFDSATYNLNITRNDGSILTQNLAILASDMTITGGTYATSTGIATFTNNTGGTFNVSGFLTGMTDTFVTGGTYSTSTGIATFTNNTGGTFSVSGFLTGMTDTFVTGGTYTAGTATFTNNTGGTFSVSGFSSGGSSSGPISVVNTSSLFSTGLSNTGYQASGVTDSNFLGTSAGYQASGSNDSNFFGSYAGNGATVAYRSNFFGLETGNGATDASYSNFFGSYAGYNATDAGASNFMGGSAGFQATNANQSNFFGYNSGYAASGASYSNFFGANAGFEAYDANNSNFFGVNSGYQAINANNSTFIGANAGYGATIAYASNFIGLNAGQYATDANNSNFMGLNAGYSATDANNSNFFGSGAHDG